MNKKNLSVVMAGAMLATSVAPVLADTTTVNGSNKGLIIKEFRELIESKTFANEAYNGTTYANKSVHYVKTAYDGTKKTVSAIGTNGTGANVVNNLNRAITDLESKLSVKLKRVQNDTTGSKPEDANNVYLKTNSVSSNRQSFTLVNDDYYTVRVSVVNSESAMETNPHQATATITVTSKKYDSTNIAAMEAAIQNAPDGVKFEAWDKGHREENGKFYAYETKVSTKQDFQAIVNHWENNKTAYPAVLDMDFDGKVLTVKVRQAEDETKHIVKTYKVGEDKLLDFRKAMSSDNKELVADYNGWITKGFDHFADYSSDDNYLSLKEVKKDIEETLVKDIEIDDADEVFTVKLSDLYDGLFLTDKGQELLDAMKLYDSKNWEIVDITSGVKNITAGEQTFRINDKSNGLYTIEMEFTKPVPSHDGKTITNRVVITTNDKAQLEYFAKGLKEQPADAGVTRKFPVQVLKGSDRYETAVKVAKENADITTVAQNGNIVLVNGDSLVDGLAAAPLAASVQNVGDDNYVAPILLTKSNTIPQVTKDYIREVIGAQTVGSLDQVTVYLVGGEGVISKGIENELKDLGLRVVRAGGDNREETSLKVAEVMYRDGITGTNGVNKDDAFFVGTNGEADAMSIASVAASLKTPIIVESPHGVTDETIDFLKGYKNEVTNDRDVTIIGGEKVVSKETENKLADEDLNVERIFGSNRQSTNAKIIDAYYGVNSTGVNVDSLYEGHKFNNVVISKDGMNSNKELIDALTATSLAVRDNAPIVLATKALSSEQINVLEKNADRNNGVYVYQVGGNSFVRDIVQTIASRVGLAK